MVVWQAEGSNASSCGVRPYRAVRLPEPRVKRGRHLRIVPRDHPLKCEIHNPMLTAIADLRPGSVAWKIGESEVAIAPIGQEDATTTTLK